MKVFEVVLRAYNGLNKELLPSTNISGGLAMEYMLIRNLITPMSVSLISINLETFINYTFQGSN